MELSPLDIEVKREAEVTRQLREEDDAHTITNSILPSPQLPIQQTFDSEDFDDTAGEDESMGGGSEIGLSRKNSTAGGGGSGTTGGSDMGTMGFSKRAQMFGTFNFESPESTNGYSSPPRFPTQHPRMNSDGDIVMATDSAVPSPVAPVEFRKMKRRSMSPEPPTPPPSSLPPPLSLPFIFSSSISTVC